MSDSGSQRAADAAWYQAVVAPRRVAVIGASSDPAKGGLLRNLVRLGFAGEIVPVNPRGGTIDGLVAATDIRHVVGPVDLALVAVPAPEVPEAIRGCAEVGVSVAYIVSSGFAELGERGALLQAEAAGEAARGGVRLLGPNSNGVISARAGLAGSIMTSVGDLSAPLADSGVAVITQSGAIGAFIFTGCLAAGLPVGTYASTGNEADVGFEELLAALVDDESVGVILAYVEGIRDGAGFVRAANRARELGKPIVVLKVGVTDEGAKASASHTASMAGSDVVYEGVFRQLGVRRARSLRELVDAGRLLARSRPTLGTRVGVVTISGGLAVMATDEIVRRGMLLPDWSDESTAGFRSVLPPYVAVHNPLDTSGVMADDMDVLRAVLEVAAVDDETDIVLLCLGGSLARERAVTEALSDIVPGLTKAVIMVWVGGSPGLSAALSSEGITSFGGVEDALAALSVAGSTACGARRPPLTVEPVDHRPRRAARVLAEQSVSAASAMGRTALDEVESKAIMRAYGIPCADERVLQAGDDVIAATANRVYPVVAKLSSPDLLHKSDVGGVRVGLADARAAQAAVVELRALGSRLGLDQIDVVLQEQVHGGIELLLGASMDPTFGPVVTLGIGGVTAEVEPDVQILLPTLTRSDVGLALDNLRSQVLLNGFRGAAPVPRSDLADVVLRFAEMVMALSADVSEIDVNPLIVDRDDGRLIAVDGLMVIRADREEVI